MNPQVFIPKTELSEFCQAHGVARFAIFGSALREDFSPASDIDVLVEFIPGRTPGLLGMADMEIQLSALFGGRKVDIQTPEDLSRYFRQEIIESAEVQYTGE
ncbi:MAG: nucleotidyltransferase family protein [Gammaproteobacteria bacterium]|nr:nucleotidyltransferase family protein [Gammaproteobacteria bacterium]